MSDTQPIKATVTIASQSIELVLTGKPDVPYKWGGGSLRPRIVIVTYRQDGIHAHLYGVWVRGNGEVSDDPCDQEYRIDDTDWPDWLVELAGDHDPRAASAAAVRPGLEAHPPHHRWYVETRDGLVDQWAPGMRFTDHAEAITRHQILDQHHPTWKDGTPVERRLVRETTSYTVEQPAVVPGGAGEEPAALTPCTCRQAVHVREHKNQAVPDCPWCMPTPDIRPSQPAPARTVDLALPDRKGA
jgi:hypothetical protein